MLIIDLYVAIAEKTKLPMQRVMLLYNAFRDIVVEELSKEGKIEIDGLGTLYSTRKESNNRLLPKFQASKELISTVNQTEEEKECQEQE